MQKTQNLLFHKLRDQDNIPLTLPSLQLISDIERGNSLKSILVILDEHLTWIRHRHSTSLINATYVFLHKFSQIKRNKSRQSSQL